MEGGGGKEQIVSCVYQVTSVRLKHGGCVVSWGNLCVESAKCRLARYPATFLGKHGPWIICFISLHLSALGS